jgi:1-acyl-sn-glycerol-3-phosphate acyltransferase
MEVFPGNPQRKVGILTSRPTSRIVAFISRTALEILCRIDNAELAKMPASGPLIMYSNHTGQLEVPLIFTQLMPRPVTGFAKIETWDNWFLHWIFDLWGAIPVRRGEADLVAMRKALEALQKGFIVGIAPEGTRSKTNALLRAHPGVVTLALRSASPLVPLAHWGGEDFLPNLKRLRRTNFHIRVGEPFRLDPGGERVTKAMRQQMADEMMYRLAALIPERYRGEYSQLEQATEHYLKPV